MPVPAGGGTARIGAGDRKRGWKVSGDYRAPQVALVKGPNPILQTAFLQIARSPREPLEEVTGDEGVLREPVSCSAHAR